MAAQRHVDFPVSEPSGKCHRRRDSAAPPAPETPTVADAAYLADAEFDAEGGSPVSTDAGSAAGPHAGTDEPLLDLRVKTTSGDIRLHRAAASH